MACSTPPGPGPARPAPAAHGRPRIARRKDPTDADVHAAVASREDLRRAEQAPEAFALLLAAAELGEVPTPLHDALVGDRDGDEEDLPAGQPARRVEHHGEQAELRREELPRPASSPLEEELDGGVLGEELADIGRENRGVEAVAADRAPDEEGAGPARGGA